MEKNTPFLEPFSSDCDPCHASDCPHVAQCIKNLQAENKSLKEALDWIAIQPCTKDAEGSDDGVPCYETGCCCTEWCLPCFAKQALEGE